MLATSFLPKLWEILPCLFSKKNTQQHDQKPSQHPPFFPVFGWYHLLHQPCPATFDVSKTQGASQTVHKESVALESLPIKLPNFPPKKKSERLGEFSPSGLSSYDLIEGKKPSLKVTASLPLKMDAWNTIAFLFGARPIFQGICQFDFREGFCKQKTRKPSNRWPVFFLRILFFRNSEALLKQKKNKNIWLKADRLIYFNVLQLHVNKVLLPYNLERPLL